MDAQRAETLSREEESVPLLAVQIWRATPWGRAEKRVQLTREALLSVGPKPRIVPWPQKLLAVFLLIVGGLIACAAVMATIGATSVGDPRVLVGGLVAFGVAVWMIARGLRLG